MWRVCTVRLGPPPSVVPAALFRGSSSASRLLLRRSLHQSSCALLAAASASSPHRPLPVFVLSRLQQLVRSESATIDAFQRAMELAETHGAPVRALEIWQLLDSAQVPGGPSISYPDPDLPARPSSSSPAAAASSSAVPVLHPLVPTAALYNQTIQALCVHGKRTSEQHAGSALGLFHRMVQQGFGVRTATYHRLMLALSEWGPPNSSGLQGVFEQFVVEAQGVERARREQQQQPHTRTNQRPSAYADHPELATFRVQTFAFESMLFALLRSPLLVASSSSSSSSSSPSASTPGSDSDSATRAKQLLESVRVRVEELLGQMASLGLAHSQSIFNSRMLLAIFTWKAKEAQKVWDQMTAASQAHMRTPCMRQARNGSDNLYPNRAVCISLMRLYAHNHDGFGDGALSSGDLAQVLANIPRINALMSSYTQVRLGSSTSSGSSGGSGRTNAEDTNTEENAELQHRQQFPPPLMLELKIEALMRAYAARRNEAAAESSSSSSTTMNQLPPLLAPSVAPASKDTEPLRLLVDILQTFAQCTQLNYALSKHTYIYIFYALHEVHTAKAEHLAALAKEEPSSPASAATAQSTLSPPSAMAAALQLDIPALMNQLAASMQEAGFVLLPQMIVFQFQTLCTMLPAPAAGDVTSSSPNSTTSSSAAATPSAPAAAGIPSKLLELVYHLSQSARQFPFFVMQGLVSTLKSLRRVSSVEFARALSSSSGSSTSTSTSTTRLSDRCEMGALNDFVVGHMVRRDHPSLAMSFEALRDLTPQDRSNIIQRAFAAATSASTWREGPVARDQLEMARILIAAEAKKRERALWQSWVDETLKRVRDMSPFSGDARAPDPLSASEVPVDAHRVLALQSLRNMLTALLPRDLSSDLPCAPIPPALIARSDTGDARNTPLSQLLEAIWSAARVFDIVGALFCNGGGAQGVVGGVVGGGGGCGKGVVGDHGLALTYAMLRLDHPEALQGVFEKHFMNHIDMTMAPPPPPLPLSPSISTRAPRPNSKEWRKEKQARESWLSASQASHRRVAQCVVAVEALGYVVRGGGSDVESFESLLLRIEHPPQFAHAKRLPLFYRNVFLAYARFAQPVKIIAYLRRMIQQQQQQQQATASNFIDDDTVAILVECVDRCSDRHTLEEVRGVLEEAATVAAAVTSAPSLFGTGAGGQAHATIQALMKAHVRLDGFASTSANNGFAPSRTGSGTLARAVSLLESPLVVSAASASSSLPLPLPMLLRLLKCALLVQDESSVERIVRHLASRHLRFPSAAASSSATPAASSSLDATTTAADATAARLLLAPASSYHDFSSSPLALAVSDWPVVAGWAECQGSSEVAISQLPAHPFLFRMPPPTESASAIASSNDAAKIARTMQMLLVSAPAIDAARVSNFPALMHALRQLSVDLVAVEHRLHSAAGLFSAASSAATATAPTPIHWDLRQAHDRILTEVTRLLASNALLPTSEATSARSLGN